MSEEQFEAFLYFMETKVQYMIDSAFRRDTYGWSTQYDAEKELRKLLVEKPDE